MIYRQTLDGRGYRILSQVWTITNKPNVGALIIFDKALRLRLGCQNEMRQVGR